MTQLTLYWKYTSLQESFVHLVMMFLKEQHGVMTVFDSQTCHFVLHFPLLLWEAKVAPHSVVSSAALLLVRSIDLNSSSGALVAGVAIVLVCKIGANQDANLTYRSPDDNNTVMSSRFTTSPAGI